MTALIAAVFLASVLGSLHCAGMCGAFLAFAVGAGADRPTGRPTLHAAYHGGRLISYVLLGIAAGSLGALVDLAGVLAGLQRPATILAALTIISFGLITALRLLGLPLRGPAPPPALARLLARGHSAAMAFDPTTRALAVGLLTTLLPCGWLYAFAFTAAGSGHPLTGALVMAAFWSGTLPVMVSLGVGLRGLLGGLGRRVPIATCLLLIAVGLYTLLGRVQLSPEAMARTLEAAPAAAPWTTVEPPCCPLDDPTDPGQPDPSR